MKRIALFVLAASLLLPTAAFTQGAPAPGAPSAKVLKVAFQGAENGFDPAQVSDVVSAALVSSLFDGLLTYDYLARPVKLKPNTAVAMPEISDNYTRFVFRLKPGIFFSDHPAFNGKPRELVAADYVYSIKRYYDPKTRSPTLFHYENAGLIGLSELRKQALESKKPFDYDTEVAGVRALDRHTLELRTSRAAPRLPYVLATPAVSGALAREVVEAAGDKIMQTPVGTGPFKLGSWKRSSRIVFERNPMHKHSVHDEQPNADDAVGQAIAQKMRGRSLPMVDRVEIAIIEEGQPRWLAFLNGELDIHQVPGEFVNLAAPNNVLAPHLVKRGISMGRTVMPASTYTYFAMEHPVVGGYTPERVALRRAVALAYDTEREVALIWRGQQVPAQTVLPPLVSSYDPKLKTEMSDHDVPRAKALLDLYGYVDKDGDGWRDQPDGQPLVLELTSETAQVSRQLQGLWKKAMDGINVKIDFKVGSWQENIKASRAGKLMMWSTGWSGALPDGGYFLDVLYAGNKGQANHARFNLPAYNTLYEQQRSLPDGPERDAITQQALRLSLAYMPIKARGHNIVTWLTHSRVHGYMPHPFLRDYWRYVDVDGPVPAPAP
jgi:ABC-type transport system substrate-binding protein